MGLIDNYTPQEDRDVSTPPNHDRRRSNSPHNDRDDSPSPFVQSPHPLTIDDPFVASSRSLAIDIPFDAAWLSYDAPLGVPEEISTQLILKAISENDAARVHVELVRADRDALEYEEISIAACKSTPEIFSLVLEWGVDERANMHPLRILELVRHASMNDAIDNLEVLSTLARAPVQTAARLPDHMRIKPIVAAIVNSSHRVYDWLTQEGFGFECISNNDLRVLSQLITARGDEFYSEKLEQYLETLM